MSSCNIRDRLSNMIMQKIDKTLLEDIICNKRDNNRLILLNIVKSLKVINIDLNLDHSVEQEKVEVGQQKEIHVSGQSTVFELTNALININIKHDKNKDIKDHSLILRILDLCPHPYPNYYTISYAVFKDLIVLASTIIDCCSYYKYFLVINKEENKWSLIHFR